MPTYLIAFVISDFTCTEGEPVEDVDVDDNGVRIPHRICSRPNSEGTPRNFSVENGPKIMNALEEITGIKYSESGIGKVDQFAIPDFAAGAMENWGLVTYREYYLLWDPVESTNRYQQYVATIVSHELGHMWFGDLITTHWWSDTFLNEGFATYCEYFGAHAVFPDWQLDKQFVISEFQPVLQLDSQATSNPLSYPASSPSDISERFGTISYSKGGSIFRMVEGFLGQKKFRQGIYLYLDNHKFRNTVPKDLWDAFGQVQGIGDSLPIGVTINEVMENWIVKPGFPVLTVSLNGRNITISQKRFLLSEEPEADEKWYVPISYTTRSEPNFEDTLPKDWLTPDKDLAISNALNNPNDWIILNVQQTGYFRVNYDEQLWERISVALLNQVNLADELTRAQIVDDLFNFAKVDLLTYSRILNIINFLEYDDSYYPWYSALTAINTLLVRLGDDVVRHVLNQHILKLLITFYASIAPVAEENDDNMIYTHKKVLALTWACRLGLEDCVSGSKQLYQRFVENGEKPNKNYRPIIYCTALRNSTNALDDWQALFEEFTRTTDTIQRPTLLTALGCTTDDDVRTEFLNRALDQNSGLRQSEVASAFSAIYTGNPSGIDFALDYLIQNYLEIVAYYSNVGPIFTGLATRLSRRQQIDKLQEFLVVNRNSLTPNVVNTISSGLTTAEANLRWTLQFEAQLKEHFDSTSSETEPSSTPTTTERNSGSKTFISWTAIVLFTLMTFSS